jgi:hypothetical protein
VVGHLIKAYQPELPCLEAFCVQSTRNRKNTVFEKYCFILSFFPVLLPHVQQFIWRSSKDTSRRQGCQVIINQEKRLRKVALLPIFAQIHVVPFNKADSRGANKYSVQSLPELICFSLNSAATLHDIKVPFPRCF